MATDRSTNHPDAPSNSPQSAVERVSAGHEHALQPLQYLADLLATSPHNLIARGGRPTVFERHILEAAALAEVLAPAGRWLDLGTGGGVPGLVLAMRHPAVAWVLLDATAKKIAEVERFATELGVPNVTGYSARAEIAAHEVGHRGSYDGVVARAVAPLPTLVELARGFLAPGGRLVAVKGPGWREELQAAAPALRRLSLNLVSTELLRSSARETWVVTMQAAGPPPSGFPRRDGLPKHDPLR